MVWLLNLSCFIMERSQIFNLRAAENDRSSAKLVAGFTRRSFQTVMFVHFLSRLLDLVLVICIFH